MQHDLNGLSDFIVWLMRLQQAKLDAVSDATRDWWSKRNVRPQDFDGYVRMERERRGVGRRLSTSEAGQADLFGG